MLEEKGFVDPQFFEKVITYLAKKAYLLDFESAVKLFGVNLRTAQVSTTSEKLLDRFLGIDLSVTNLANVDFKTFSYLVWSMSHCSDRAKVSQVFERYEVCVASKPSLTLKQSSYLLWAVTLKFKISKMTFDKLVLSLTDFLTKTFNCSQDDLMAIESADGLATLASKAGKHMEEESLLEATNTWEVMNILWGLSKFNAQEADLLIPRFFPVVQNMFQYFSGPELVMLFRVFSSQDYFSSIKTNGKKTTGETKRESSSQISVIKMTFYDQLIDQLLVLSSTLEDDHILIVMHQLVHSKHLQYKDHTASLRKLFSTREELKAKIKVKKDIIYEDLDSTELKAKRDILYDKVKSSSTRSNLINKPL